MKTKLPKETGDPLFLLNAAIGTLDLARNTTSVNVAKDVFSSVSLLITTIRVCSLLVHFDRLLTDVCRIRLSGKLIVLN